MKLVVNRLVLTIRYHLVDMIVRCGADGFWYDNGAKVDASGIDCTAKKSDLLIKDEGTREYRKKEGMEFRVQ